MEFSSLRFADVVVAAPVGRVDHASAAQLEQALAPLLEPSAADTGAIVLDFAGVHYISSVGLRVLMIAAKKLRARQAAIGVAALQPVVQEIFDISRFDHVVEIYPSVRDALQALSAPALAAYEVNGGPPAR
jgi:anti-sigma B factor antagonist/stage II sporulation protein AA (anti-sigma F factor antagonist)